MHVLINLQPSTKEEMIFWNAFSFVHSGSSPYLYKALKSLGLLKPQYIRAPYKHAEMFWEISGQCHKTGKDISEKLNAFLYPEETRIITTLTENALGKQP